MGWLESFREADTETVPEELLRRPSPDRVPCTADDLDLPTAMDDTEPLVSVIVPTYEDSEYLPEALESVGAQTHPNLELVIVDSSGVNWVEQLAADREWVSYIHQPPQGLSVARNDGIETARGEYVALLDADDYWHPDKLTRQVQTLGSGGTFAYTACYRVRFDDQPIVTCHDLNPPSDDPVMDRLTDRITVTPSTVLFRRSALPDRPFDDRLTSYEDVIFLVETFTQHQPAHIGDPMVLYRDRSGSLSDDRELMYQNAMTGIESLGEQFPELASVLTRRQARSEQQLGVWYLKRDDHRAARSHFRRCLRLDPTAYRSLVLAGVTLLPVGRQTVVRALQRLRTAVVYSLSNSRQSVRICERPRQHNA